MSLNYAVDQYRQVKVQTGVQAADPHRLVAMLFEGLVEKTLGARVRMLQGDVAGKATLISGAIAIVEALRASLDQEQGGAIAANLDALYEYMARRLLEANMHNDPAALDEVALLTRNIADAWAAIAPQPGLSNPAETAPTLSIGA